MPPDSELNPYAPPNTEAVRPIIFQEEGLSKRPASTKWAMAIFALHLVSFFVSSNNFIEQSGWDGFVSFYQYYPLQFVQPVLSFVSLIVIAVPNRKPAVFWLVSCTLILTCYNGIPRWLMKLVALVRAYPELDPSINLVDLLIRSILIPLCVSLSYRFIFGRPSRVYFRVARNSKEEGGPI